jgi:hypothetical protein
VFRLAENLHLSGESDKAIDYLGKMEEKDFRAAVLLGRIICSKSEMTNIVPIAEQRVANALRHHLSRQPISRFAVQRLLDVACCLYKKQTVPAAPEWLKLLQAAVRRPEIFGAGLDVLLRHRVFDEKLTELCNELLQQQRGDDKRVLRYYLGSLANRLTTDYGKIVSSLREAPVLTHEDVVAITPCFNETSVNSKTFLEDLRFWTDDLEVWWHKVSETDINDKLLRSVKSVDPVLVDAHTFVESARVAERSVWIDKDAFMRLRTALLGNSQRGSFAQIDDCGVAFSWTASEALIPNESDPFVQYSAARVDARYFSSNRQIVVGFAV